MTARRAAGAALAAVLLLAVPGLMGCRDDLAVLLGPAEASSTAAPVPVTDVSPYAAGTAGEALTKYLRAWTTGDTEALDALTEPSQRGRVTGAEITGVRVRAIVPAPEATAAWLAGGAGNGAGARDADTRSFAVGVEFTEGSTLIGSGDATVTFHLVRHGAGAPWLVYASAY